MSRIPTPARRTLLTTLFSVVASILLLSACGGGGGGGGNGTSGNSGSTPSDTWIWASGSDIRGQVGIYGTKGITASTNAPGARSQAVSWTDRNGNLWLFGGIALTSGNYQYFNDLWKFDGTNWTWISGSNTAGQVGVYGTRGVAANANVPGARSSSVSWIDTNGNLWLFGGIGYDSAGTFNFLNDLWKFDGTNWTWISGSNTAGQVGVYGTRGVAASANVPGARSGSVSWRDSSGALWLFGGDTYEVRGNINALVFFNDLWKFDGTNWAWISGSNTTGQSGIYGTKGVTASTNVPGARSGSVSWIDANGNLWLFGGAGHDSAGFTAPLNDLWKFDGVNWTWISGSNVVLQPGVYGSKGIAASTNTPGARDSAVSWTDSSGSLWLFGGGGYDSTRASNYLNDLWKFDGTNWAWISGSNTGGQVGVYGTRGVAAGTNVPGARSGSAIWRDGSGNFWLFGGIGYDSAGVFGSLNDLWRYRP